MRKFWTQFLLGIAAFVGAAYWVHDEATVAVRAVPTSAGETKSIFSGDGGVIPDAYVVEVTELRALLNDPTGAGTLKFDGAESDFNTQKRCPSRPPFLK